MIQLVEKWNLLNKVGICKIWKEMHKSYTKPQTSTQLEFVSKNYFVLDCKLLSLECTTKKAFSLQ